MKLYSRHSIVIAAAGGVAAGILSTWWIFNLKKPSKQTPSESSQDSALYQEVSAQDSELQEITPNLIQTSAPSAATTPSAYTTDEQQNIFVYEKCNEAVVNITTQVMGINWFLEPIVQDGGSGSGSIIDKRGYVVTNVHVISKANKITISLADGTSYEGRVVGQDIESDIAVLKFDPPANVSLKTISFGDSDNLKVGQKVIAIGNPFALERTMTTGIISGLGRPIPVVLCLIQKAVWLVLIQ